MSKPFKLLRQKMSKSAKHYLLERQAEFLLSNAVSEADYKEAREVVRQMGLDPDSISHYKLSNSN
jgi:hypothetical protein